MFVLDGVAEQSWRSTATCSTTWDASIAYTRLRELEHGRDRPSRGRSWPHDDDDYRSHPRVVATPVPEAELVTAQVLSMPMHPALSANDVERFVEALRSALGETRPGMQLLRKMQTRGRRGAA